MGMCHSLSLTLPTNSPTNTNLVHHNGSPYPPIHRLTYSPQRLGLQPVRLAAPWIAFAFAGYLPPEQTLLLWDRVLGFDSLEPLVIT